MKQAFLLLMLLGHYCFSQEEGEKVIILDEVTIFGERNRFVQKGDSLIIYLSGDETRPHASALSLFERISGLEIDVGGQIKVLGRAIPKVTIEGRTIFGGVSQMSLDAIKADMVEKMELIQSTSPSGSTQTSLNIVLKQSRKNGFYGELTGGGGLTERFFLQGKFSKLTSNGFLSAFSTANNINERGIESKSLNRFLVSNFLNQITAATSIVSAYEDPDNSFKDGLENSLFNAMVGINKAFNNGLNYTVTKSKMEFNGYLYSNTNRELFLENQVGSRIWGESSQSYTREKERLKRSQQLFGNAYLNWKPAKKFTLSLANQFQYDGNRNVKIHENESITLLPTLFETNNAYSRNGTDNNNSNTLLIGLSKRYNRLGTISTLVYKNVYQEYNGFTSFTNTTSFYSQNQEFVRDNYHWYQDLHFTHSVPLSKRFLIEGKLRYFLAKDKLNFDLLSTGSSKWQAIENAQINELVDINFYNLFRTKKITVISGLGIWNWDIKRDYFSSIIHLEKSFMVNPFTSVEWKLPNSVLNFRFSKIPVLPHYSETISIPDSSNIHDIRFGNPYLDSYHSETYKIRLESGIAKGFKLSLQASFSEYEKFIIRENLFEPKLGTFGFTYFNSELPNQSINIIAQLFVLRLNKDFTWNLSLQHSRLKFFQQTDGQLSIIQTDLGNLGINTYWKVSQNLKSNLKLNSYLNRLNSTLQTSHSLKHFLSVDIGNKTYLESVLIYNLNQSDRIQGQVFLDIQFGRFFLKNDKMKASVVFKNLFNNKFLIAVQQTENTYFASQRIHLPFTGLVTFSFFPEKWKK